MLINCRHGFFYIYEEKAGQVSAFSSLFGLPILPKNDFYTFQPLLGVQKYSLIGKNILNLPAVKTFEGTEGEVFEANSFVYDFTTGLLKNINSVTTIVRIKQAGTYFVSNGLILPGSVTADGGRVKDYSARYSRDTQRFYYSEVTYV